jgi:hypothetical protein
MGDVAQLDESILLCRRMPRFQRRHRIHHPIRLQPVQMLIERPSAAHMLYQGKNQEQ